MGVGKPSTLPLNGHTPGNRNPIGYGTKEHLPRTNFSRLSGSIITIPNGTEVYGCNFAQETPQPGEEVIQGLNLTFIKCNMVNVRKHPSWTYIDCNNTITLYEYDAEGNLIIYSDWP